MQPSNGTSTAITRPDGASYQQAGAAIERRGFGSSELEVHRETQGIAAAEQAKALVQARFIMAMQRPRDFDNVRVRLLKHCDRPGFAAVAEYAKPVGGSSVRGPSIRFVETALQEYGNVTVDNSVTYDDDEKRVVRVSVADLERNLPYTEDVTVEKFVERRNPKQGDEVISERRNKQGATVYRIRATEDDYANKLAAAVSKKIRNLGLRILPADLVDEAMDRCAATRQKKDAEDPGAAVRKVADAFAGLNILPSALKEYLGHEIGTSSPVEIEELRKVYTALRDSETSWQAALDAKKAERGEATSGAPVDKVADKLKEKLATAPAKDKASAKEDPAVTARKLEAKRRAFEKQVEWMADGDGFRAAVGDVGLIVEPSGPRSLAWYVTNAGEDRAQGEIEGEHADALPKAKAAAIDAAMAL